MNGFLTEVQIGRAVPVAITEADVRRIIREELSRWQRENAPVKLGG